MGSSGSGSLMKFQPRRQLELKPSEDSTRAGDLTSQVAHTWLLAGGFSSYHSNLSLGCFSVLSIWQLASSTVRNPTGRTRKKAKWLL